MGIKLLNQNDKPVSYKRLVFAGGEVHVNVADINEDFLAIHADFRNSDDIMEVLLLKDALYRNGCRNIRLIITYLPYARQDRVCTAGDAYSLQVFTYMINAAKFYSITVYDCHSQVGLDLLKSTSGVVEDYTQLQHLIDSDYRFAPNAVIVAPDKGALLKSAAIAKYFELPLITAEKLRDPDTGQLSGFKLNAEPMDIKDKNVYVFDDICDGGGTFLGLGSLIADLEPREMYLYLTNGIFSNPGQLAALEEMYVLDSTYKW